MWKRLTVLAEQVTRECSHPTLKIHCWITEMIELRGCAVLSAEARCPVSAMEWAETGLQSMLLLSELGSLLTKPSDPV